MRHKKECKVVGFCSPSYQQPLSLSWTESHLQKKKKKKKSVRVWGTSLDAGVVCLALLTYPAPLSTQLLSHADGGARRKPSLDFPRSLRTLPWRSHPLCPSRNVSLQVLVFCFFFLFLFSFSLSSFSASSTVSCRAAELLATLRQPLGLISVRTRLPSLPLRAPNATAHASNSSVQRTYDWPT